eukprot:scaffold4797_cov152-Skeletonema_marinoi.AAC.16
MTAVNAAAAATATLDMLVCHGAGIFRYDATIMLSSVICAIHAMSNALLSLGASLISHLSSLISAHIYVM